jgi:hypothetical protein
VSKIEVEVTDENLFNAGWLGYLLGIDRPDPETDPMGADGWDMGKQTPSIAPIRMVFTRQALTDKPQYIVTVRPTVGPRGQEKLTKVPTDG